MIARIIAIIFIFLCTTIAWVILGGTVGMRTDDSDSSLRSDVSQLWGNALHQKAPALSYTVREPVPVTNTTIKKDVPDSVSVGYDGQLDASDIDVKLHLDYRQKGLLWYSTYRVAFNGRYRIANTGDRSRHYTFSFPFPGSKSVYENFHMTIGSREVQMVNLDSGKIEESFDLPPGASVDVTIGFGSNGMDDWWYTFGEDVNQVRNFSLAVHTNFDDIDFPEQSMSPTSKERTSGGWDLHWRYSNLLSGVRIGISMPEKLNPGPWVAQVTFFAPVSLFLFFFFMFIFTTLKKIRLHPMHYFFISAAFFSFHLLLAYLVDHISIHTSFIIASIVSIGLVVSYMRIVVGRRFAFVEIGISQFIYLVLFSYTFFFKGYTGLTITIACVVTLFIIMQTTARIDWDEVFGRDRARQQQAIDNIREKMRRQEQEENGDEEVAQ